MSEEKLVGMRPCARETVTDSGPRGSDGKVTERKKGTGEIKSKNLQRTINQFKRIFPSLPESARFIREQVASSFHSLSSLAGLQGMGGLLPCYGRSGTHF